MSATNLADLYGTPNIEWARVEASLEAGYPQAPGTGGPNRHTCWLATVNADGSPQVNGIGTHFVDGSFWFETGDGTRKARNLARDARCSLSVALDDFDVVVEGEAHRITDPATVAKLAAVFRDGGWPAEVDESGTALTAPFSAPSAGPPPWYVYRIDARTATVLLTVEPGGATRFRF